MSLIISNALAVESNESVDIEALQFFYSVKIKDKDTIELELFEYSVPALLNYKTKQERVFVLSTGDYVEIFIDKERKAKSIFKFHKIQNNMIYGAESLLLPNKKEMSGNVHFAEYPVIK